MKKYFMDFELEDKQDAEFERINFYRQVCFDALTEFSENHPFQLTEHEKDKINSFLERMFESELDYLERDPQDYFDLYEED